MKKQSKILIFGIASALTIGASIGAALGFKSLYQAEETKAAGVFTLTEENGFTEEEGFVYSAALDCGNNSVTTKMYGVDISSGSMTVASGGIAYFTNTDPVRGFDKVSTTLSKGSGDMYGAFYFSYNPLNLNDIFGGKYQDLTAAMNSFNVSDDYMVYADPTYDPDMLEARYVLGLMFNVSSSSFTIGNITYSTPCGKEPEKVDEIGLCEDYSNTSKEIVESTTGESIYLPFVFGNGSYMYAGYQPGEYDFMFMSIQTTTTINNIPTALEGDGYSMTYYSDMGASGTLLVYQKTVSTDVLSCIMMVAPIEGTNYMYLQLAGSKTYPLMTPDTVWPVDKILSGGASQDLIDAFEPFNLTNAEYTYVGAHPEFGTLVHAVLVKLDPSSSTVNEDEIDAYVALYEANSNYTVHRESYGISISQKVTNFYMYISIDGSSISVSITEHMVYDHLPLAEFASSIEEKMAYPKLGSLDGTFTGRNTRSFITSGVTVSDMDSFLSSLESYGYVVTGDSEYGQVMLPFDAIFDDTISRIGYYAFKSNFDGDYIFEFDSNYISKELDFGDAFDDIGLYMTLGCVSLPDNYNEAFKLCNFPRHNSPSSSVVALPSGDADDVTVILESIVDSGYDIEGPVNGLYTIKDGWSSDVTCLEFDVRPDGLLIHACTTNKKVTYENAAAVQTMLNTKVLTSFDAEDAFVDLPNDGPFIGSDDEYDYEFSYLGTYQEVEQFKKDYETAILATGNYTYKTGSDNFIHNSKNIGIYVRFNSNYGGSLYELRIGYRTYPSGYDYETYADSGIASLDLIVDNFPELPHSSNKRAYYLNYSTSSEASIIIDPKIFDASAYRQALTDAGFVNERKVIGNNEYYCSISYSIDSCSIYFQIVPLLSKADFLNGFSYNTAKTQLQSHFIEFSNSWKYRRFYDYAGSNDGSVNFAIFNGPSCSEVIDALEAMGYTKSGYDKDYSLTATGMKYTISISEENSAKLVIYFHYETISE